MNMGMRPMEYSSTLLRQINAVPHFGLDVFEKDMAEGSVYANGDGEAFSLFYGPIEGKKQRIGVLTGGKFMYEIVAQSMTDDFVKRVVDEPEDTPGNAAHSVRGIHLDMAQYGGQHRSGGS